MWSIMEGVQFRISLLDPLGWRNLVFQNGEPSSDKSPLVSPLQISPEHRCQWCQWCWIWSPKIEEDDVSATVGLQTKSPGFVLLAIRAIRPSQRNHAAVAAKLYNLYQWYFISQVISVTTAKLSLLPMGEIGESLPRTGDRSQLSQTSLDSRLVIQSLNSMRLLAYGSIWGSENGLDPQTILVFLSRKLAFEGCQGQWLPALIESCLTFQVPYGSTFDGPQKSPTICHWLVFGDNPYQLWLLGFDSSHPFTHKTDIFSWAILCLQPSQPQDLRYGRYGILQHLHGPRLERRRRPSTRSDTSRGSRGNRGAGCFCDMGISDFMDQQ